MPAWEMITLAVLKCSTNCGGWRKFDELDVFGLPAALADLGEHVSAPAFTRPSVDDLHHAVEGKISAYSHENHNTLP